MKWWVSARRCLGASRLMSESLIHMELVRLMAGRVAADLLGGDASLIVLDSPNGGPGRRPPVIQGHIPDLYVHQTGRTMLILGEAKTARDIETERCERQLAVFLNYCAIQENAILVVAVPWYKTRFTRSLLRVLHGRLAAPLVRTTVLEMLPG
jgi:hypothetical protein